MKLREVYRAAEALGEIGKNPALTAREAYGIMKLRSALREDAAFFAGRRNELLKRFGEPDAETPGKYNFTDKDKMEAFQTALRELADTDALIRYEPVSLRGELTGITADMLSALDGLVSID